MEACLEFVGRAVPLQPTHGKHVSVHGQQPVPLEGHMPDNEPCCATLQMV